MYGESGTLQENRGEKMHIDDEEYQCEDCGGVLVFVKIAGQYAIYQCVNCDHCERIAVEDPNRGCYQHTGEADNAEFRGHGQTP